MVSSVLVANEVSDSSRIVSMVDGVLFDKLEAIACAISKKSKFGGLQVRQTFLPAVTLLAHE